MSVFGPYVSKEKKESRYSHHLKKADSKDFLLQLFFTGNIYGIIFMYTTLDYVAKGTQSHKKNLYLTLYFDGLSFPNARYFHLKLDLHHSF